MDTTRASIASRLDRLTAYARASPLRAAGTAFAVLVALVPTITYGVRSYWGFLALGPGGLPYNIFGWALQGTVMRLLARPNTTDASLYRKIQQATYYDPPYSRKSFLPAGAGSLPTRAGDRPTVPNYVAPQRQSSQTASAATKEQMQFHLHALAAANEGVLQIKTSRLERRGPALWVAEDQECPPLLQKIGGEMFHIHPSDGSAHLVLSLADAAEAMDKGWVERHQLSGVMGQIPVSYVLVYAPRDEGELEIWKALVGAAVRFSVAGYYKVNVNV